jgi:hypothetical protein
VDRNHMASMDCVFNTQRYQIIHMASRLEDCRWKNCKTARDEGSSHDQARSTSLVIRAAPRLTTGSRLENAAAAMSASAFSPSIVGGGRHRRHDNIANSDLAKMKSSRLLAHLLSHDPTIIDLLPCARACPGGSCVCLWIEWTLTFACEDSGPREKSMTYLAVPTESM